MSQLVSSQLLKERKKITQKLKKSKADAKLTAYDDWCLVSQYIRFRRNVIITISHNNMSDEAINLLDLRTDLLFLFPRKEMCLTVKQKR